MRAPESAAGAAINLVLRDCRRPPNGYGIPELLLCHQRSSEWGLHVIRTVWLGFTFLIILAGAGSFRFAFGHFDIANASNVVPSEHDRAVEVKIVEDNLTKADQLPVAYVAAAPDAAELARAAYSAVEAFHPMAQAAVTSDNVRPAPEVVEPKVAQPAAPLVRPAPPVVRKAKAQKPNLKQPKLEAIARKSPAIPDLKVCQLEEFEAFRYAFSLPTGCHKAAAAISNQLVPTREPDGQDQSSDARPLR